MKTAEHCSVAGIEVSKDTLDIAITGQTRAWQIKYQPTAIEKMIACFSKHQVQLVVLEATGGLEWPVIEQLDAAGFKWHRANPRQVRNFARARNQLAKTDRIDARILADYAVRMEPKPHQLPGENRRKLTYWVRRHEQLGKMRVQERNRLSRCFDLEIAADLEQHIEQLDQRIEQAVKKMQPLVEADQDMQRDAKLLITVPGVAQLTAGRLVALLPELGRCNRQQIARLLGVAPINRDSGQMRGKRMTGGGRREVRRMMYLPTVVAMRHNPVIRVRYEHLLAQGKTKMVALIACMRKLITLLNTMIREQKTWEQLVYGS